MARTRPSVRVVVDADAFVSAALKESLWPRPGRDLLFLGLVFPGMVDDAGIRSATVCRRIGLC
jgi:hypothetical protein